MDVAILLDDVLQVLARHAVDRVPNVHFGGDQQREGHEEDDSPDIVNPTEDVIYIDSPAIEDED